MRKLTYEQVKKIFEDGGCELLGEYINSKISLKYKCFCGQISKTDIYNFKKNSGCKICSKKRLLIGYIKFYFKSCNCKLLSKEYKNNREKLKYICECGNESEINFSNFKKGVRCKECQKGKLSIIFKHSYDHVKKYFEDNGCKLIEKKYKNSNTPLKYICECGNKSIIRFDEFKQGHRCSKCGASKRSGKNAYNYNSNLTDEDRMDRRLIPGYKEWVKNVYKKDNWICQKCKIRKDNKNKYKKLNAHHIEGYAQNRELRITVNNGITFCECCHKEFHKKYGTKNNTKYQLDEFLKEGILCLKLN